MIGDPVEHSISPDMQNAAFEKLGLDYIYVAFRVAQNSIAPAMDGIRSLGLRGANVTIPHKSSVVEYLDELDKSARKIGAVNTIKRDGQHLRGFNTDGIGAIRALKSVVKKIEDKNILLLGAGGAARAIAHSLAEIKVNLTISNRTISKAKELVSDVKKKTGVKIEQIPLKEEILKKYIKKSDILINSTSVGMHPNEDETLVRAEMMHPDLTVMDIVYNPLKTLLLREAKKAGGKTINGLEMLVQQGAASFQIWTGKKAPVKTMKRAAKNAMEEK